MIRPQRRRCTSVTAEANLASRYATAIERLEHLRGLHSAFVDRTIHTDEEMPGSPG